MRPTRRLLLAGAVGAAVMPRAAAAVPVVVSSKLDIEGGLIGAMILQALQSAGIATENRLLLGPTAIVRQALLGGAIDLYPEYTGNAAFFSHTEADPVWKDAAAGYRRAAELDVKNGLVWLPPAPADNTWVLAVPAALSRASGLRSLDDFGRYVRGGAPVRLAASAEFVESAAGLPAFETDYGFRLTARQLLVLSGGETSATMKAAADGISGVNVAMAYGTDGALGALDLVVLDDTKHAQPVYAPAPVVRRAALDREPRIRDVLAPVFASLDIATLRQLNARIAVEGQSAEAVAAGHLRAMGK